MPKYRAHGVGAEDDRVRSRTLGRLGKSPDGFAKVHKLFLAKGVPAINPPLFAGASFASAEDRQTRQAARGPP
jgi:hypothetical protein